MGTTFEELLNQFCAARDANYRDEPERNEARLDNMESTLQSMLELLRDGRGRSQ